MDFRGEVLRIEKALEGGFVMTIHLPAAKVEPGTLEELKPGIEHYNFQLSRINYTPIVIQQFVDSSEFDEGKEKKDVQTVDKKL